MGLVQRIKRILTNEERKQCDDLLEFLRGTRDPRADAELREWRYVTPEAFAEAVTERMPHLTGEQKDYLVLNADYGYRL